MPSRPCDICLALRHRSVFADFELRDEEHIVLLRMSFDGYGCCATDSAEVMPAADSRLLLDALDTGELDNAAVEAALRRYFNANTNAIWFDALAEYDLL